MVRILVTEKHIEIGNIFVKEQIYNHFQTIGILYGKVSKYNWKTAKKYFNN